jgi:hypothetical protein
VFYGIITAVGLIAGCTKNDVVDVMDTTNEPAVSCSPSANIVRSDVTQVDSEDIAKIRQSITDTEALYESIIALGDSQLEAYSFMKQNHQQTMEFTNEDWEVLKKNDY